MKTARLRLLLMAGVTLCGLSGLASAQPLPEGRLYAFHSNAQGGCPALDWHVVVGAGNTLVGMISWNNMQSLARATGTVNEQSRTFQMTATEQGGQGRTATIDGVLRDAGYLEVNIKGAHFECRNIMIRWFVNSPAG